MRIFFLFLTSLALLLCFVACTYKYYLCGSSFAPQQSFCSGNPKSPLISTRPTLRIIDLVSYPIFEHYRSRTGPEDQIFRVRRLDTYSAFNGLDA